MDNAYQSYLSNLPSNESEKIEFKALVNDGLKKDILAFANSEGGDIFLGVADDGSIVGLGEADAEIRKISNWVRDAIKPDLSLFVRYEVVQQNNHDLVRINVARGTNRPYYLARRGLRPEGVYVRQGSSSVPASDTAIRSMIKSTDGDRYEEMRSLQQSLTFAATEKQFEMQELSFTEIDQTNLKLKTMDGMFTNLGFLFSDQCEHSVKVAVVDLEEEFQFRDRREFNGSLLQQLYEVYDYLDLNNQLKSTFSGLHRKDLRDYPEVAIREALLNLLVHRDYSISASALITVFDDRIELVSVGGLPEGVEIEDILVGLSVCRNPNLANVFYRLTLIEAYGTGIRKIFRSYENYPNKPEIIATPNAFKIVLPNRNAPIENKTVTISEKLGTYAANQSAPLTEEEQIILEMLEQSQTVTREEVQNELEVSQATAYRYLTRLMEKGLVERNGRGKRTRYVLVGR